MKEIRSGLPNWKKLGLKMLLRARFTSFARRQGLRKESSPSLSERRRLSSAAWKMRTTRGILFPCSTGLLLPSAKECKSRLSRLRESKPRSGAHPSSTTSVARKRLRFGAGPSDGLGDIGMDLQA